MLEIIIYAMELAFVMLVALLSYRVYSLYQELRAIEIENSVTQSVLGKLMHGEASTNNTEYTIKMNALKQTQVFSGIQLLPLKRKYHQFNQAKYDWLREASAYYLIGSVVEITRGHDCTEQSIREIVDLVLKSSLDLPFHQSNSYINQILNSDANLEHHNIFQVGQEATRLWLSDNNTPHHLSLMEYLNRNAVLS